MIYSAFDLIHVYIVYKYIYIYTLSVHETVWRKWEELPSQPVWSLLINLVDSPAATRGHEFLKCSSHDFWGGHGKVIACWNFEDPPNLYTSSKTLGKKLEPKKKCHFISLHKIVMCGDAWKKKLNKPRHSSQTFWIQWQSHGFVMSFSAKVSPFQLDDHLRFIMLNGESPPKR